MTRILLMLLSLGILSITNGCYFDPSSYNNYPSYRGRGNQTRDDQTRIKNDGTADETGIRMPAVISLEQVSMIMVIRRGRIGLVGNGHREGWRRDVDLQPIENKVLSWDIIGISASMLADIPIRKSQSLSQVAITMDYRYLLISDEKRLSAMRGYSALKRVIPNCRRGSI